MLRKISRLLAMLVMLVNFSCVNSGRTDRNASKSCTKRRSKKPECSTVIVRWRKSTPRRFTRLFEKRFPGIKINHVDATSDKLSARAITEARGGKTLADVVEFGLEDINKIHEQGLILGSRLRRKRRRIRQI